MTAKKMFYSMGEVSEMFDVNPSLIRHWESKFDCLRPHKNKKGNRMFSPSDIEKLKQIYHLVKERGMTLEGANKAMKSSRGGLSRDTELLERLQRIRAALEEVREELRDGAQDAIVDGDADGGAAEISVRLESPDVAAEREYVSGAEAVSGVVAASVAEESGGTVSESAAEGGDASQAAEGSAPVASVAAAQGEPAHTAGAAGAGTGAKTSVAGAVPPKSRARRRRKGDDEDKELFPFYEQSLF